MKKTITLLTAILLTINALALDVWDGSAAPWTNGSGTEDDPYLIETAANLAYLAQKVSEGYQAQGMEVFANEYFLMTDDLDLNNISWTPIGNVDYDGSSLSGFYFAGIFDGWYHNIDHLRIQTSASLTGLFAGLGGNGVIQHLSLTNGNINSSGFGAAGIVGATAVSAIVGQCSFSGTISISNSDQFCGAGGIVGAAAENSAVIECSYRGSITASNSNFMGAAGAGGIVGVAINQANIRACYNTGNITGSAMIISVAAGILGATLDDANIKIEDCYNTGTLSGNTKGGIFGMVSPINPFKGEAEINVTNSYYLNTCGGTTSYGTSKTSAEMQTEEFKNTLDGASHVFTMDNGGNNGYPIHTLVGVRLNDAESVTAHSAILSAEVHKVNLTFMNLTFVYAEENSTDYQEFEVAQNDHVELAIEDLAGNTTYSYSIVWRFDDVNYNQCGPKYFTTEVDDIDEISYLDINIYPNPTSDFIYIESIEPQQVTIYSLDGKMIKSIENTNIVDVRDLDKDIYLINIDGIVKKLIIEN